MAKKKASFKKIQEKIRGRAKKIIKYVGYKWVLPRVYSKYSKQPIDKKLVIFADFRDRDMPDNFRGLYELCQENGFNCVVFSGTLFADKIEKWARRKNKIRFHFDFIREFAQCRVLFLTDWFPPAYIVQPRPETEVVQLWHACGAFKMFGYSTDEKKWGASVKEKKRYPSHNTYTLACVSGEKAIAPFENGFHSNPGVVQALGCPRTDFYFDRKSVESISRKVRMRYPEIGDRKIILYAPTFRGNSIAKASMKVNLPFTEMMAELSDQYVMFIKLHPQTAKSNGINERYRISCLGTLYDVTKTLSTEEALCVADILITDYSSIIFEYMLFERPIISYIYDIDEYIADRGLYFPYEQIAPGPYVFTPEELLDKLKTVSKWFDPTRIRELRQEFMSACDGHSTERIYNYVFGDKQITRCNEARK